MRRAHRSRAVALAGVLTLGCTEHPSPTAPAASPTPSFAVERGTAAFGIPLGDERYTLIVGHTYEDMAAICARTAPSFPTWDQLTVTRPTGRGAFEESVKQLTRAKDVVFTVFEYAPFEFGNECPLLAAPYYEGSGRAFLEDNDVFLTHHGANVFNFGATGTVADQSGRRYRVVARLHQILSTESTLDNWIFLQPPRIDIQLTPIGR
jgi:hypothetical protein